MKFGVTSFDKDDLPNLGNRGQLYQDDLNDLEGVVGDFKTDTMNKIKDLYATLQKGYDLEGTVERDQYGYYTLQEYIADAQTVMQKVEQTLLQEWRDVADGDGEAEGGGVGRAAVAERLLEAARERRGVGAVWEGGDVGRVDWARHLAVRGHATLRHVANNREALTEAVVDVIVRPEEGLRHRRYEGDIETARDHTHRARHESVSSGGERPEGAGDGGEDARDGEAVLAKGGGPTHVRGHVRH